MSKHYEIQTEIAKQKGKGGSRDGDFKDRETPKGAATRSYETNPATGKGSSDRTIKKSE